MKKRLTIILTSIVLALIVPLSGLLISKLKVDTVSTNIAVRTVELQKESIDYESILNEFENATLETTGTLTTFEGYKPITLSDLTELDNVSETDVEQIESINVKYNFSYDAETNLVTVAVTTEYEDGETEVDEICGAAFVNENGELDALLDIDGEYILLSEMQDMGLIENCGWFKKLFKKVANTVKKVCNTAIGVVGAVATVAVPAVIGVVCACTGVGLIATVAIGAVAGAAIASGTAAISTYQQDGKVDWEAVGICAGIGAAVGAIASGVSYGITKLIIGKGKVSKDIDMDKISEHVFSNDHLNNGIMDLGSSKDDILTKFFDTARSNSSKWVEGSNEIRTIINGKEATIRFFVKNGEIINLDGFAGTSSRVIGNLINLIK